MSNQFKFIYIRVIIFIILIISISCKFLKHKDIKPTCIELIVNYPILKPETGQLTNLTDTIPIFYLDNFTLYKLPFTKSIENENGILSVEKAYAYFIHKTKSTCGIWFNSLRDSNNGVLLPVDSVLKKRAYLTDFGILVDSMNKKYSLFENMIYLEKYVFRKKATEMSFDSVYLYYNKHLNEIQYSFSPKLDSVRKLKLFKIRLLYNEANSPLYSFLLPKREFLFEIREPERANQNDVEVFKYLIDISKNRISF